MGLGVAPFVACLNAAAGQRRVVASAQHVSHDSGRPDCDGDLWNWLLESYGSRKEAESPRIRGLREHGRSAAGARKKTDLERAIDCGRVRCGDHRWPRAA